ncbi:homogentisate 1,2-dioxygenase [Thozetella sp. PMI_491]|nr:homogentisate 1,2-dioxygenase [Thozetella sp. PMI_491]
MAPFTTFAVEDPYQYLEGFGNFHRSEAIPGATPKVINSPQRPPFGLRTERMSGTSFTAPREQNLQTFLYRCASSLYHSDFTPWKAESAVANPATPTNLGPNSYMWPNFSLPSDADWTSQHLLGRTGDPQQKTGIAIWVFAVSRSMPERTAWSSLDGESLIVPQSGALDIQTEQGKLVVRQNEIAVIPRGVRYRVTLLDGRPCRGYICELFEGHFRLPNLGIIGSTGLANVQDFQIPVAFFDGSVVNGVAQPADKPGTEWTILSRLNGKLWSCTQDHTPFDVAAWHGTCYPFKYDLARFCVLGNALFDEHDPSLYVVLTAPAYGKAPGTAVVDFAIIPPRWQVAEDTYWLPYYHRNTMQEFFGPIINAQDPKHPLNKLSRSQFFPFAAGLNGSMVTHGAAESEFKKAIEVDTKKPTKLQDDGLTLFLFETECPIYLSDWALAAANQNFAKRKGTGKL